MSSKQQVLPSHLLEAKSHPIPGVQVNPVNHQKLAEEYHLDDMVMLMTLVNVMVMMILTMVTEGSAQKGGGRGKGRGSL